MSENAVFEAARTVHWEHLDPSGGLRMSACAAFFQETAASHIQKEGVGFHFLQEQNLVWVISRMRLLLLSDPVWNDEILIQTWATGIDRLFGTREFQILKTDGRKIATASTSWLLIDTATRRPRRPENIIGDFPVLPEKKAADRVPKKLPELKEIFSQSEFMTRHSDIDMNGHVNNARYIEWIFDCIPSEIIRTEKPSILEINFLAETGWNDKISLRCGKGAISWLIEATGQKYDDDKPFTVFRAEVEMTKR